MSDRAVEFFERWCAEHVNTVSRRDHAREAQRLARQCLNDASQAGISARELKEDLAQDIVAEFAERLDAQADEEAPAAAGRAVEN
jgi:hypothetical protein